MTDELYSPNRSIHIGNLEKALAEDEVFYYCDITVHFEEATAKQRLDALVKTISSPTQARPNPAEMRDQHHSP